jgi:hypothetical protein
MMRHEGRRCGGVLWLALAATLAAAQAGADQPAGGKASAPTVQLAAEEQGRLGVATEVLAAATAPTGIASSARVLDPAPLIQLDGELSAAAASAAASQAEAARTRKLYTEDRTASAHALETAEAQAAADVQHLQGAQRRLLIEWGDGVAGLSGARRAELLNDLAHVRAELVRVELPPGVAAPARGSVVELLGSEPQQPRRASVLGVLPVADPRLQTRGVLAEIRGPEADLAVGEMLSARLGVGQRGARGVLVPRGALLRKDARVWVYVQTAPTTFERREVSGYQPLAAGWFVSAGLTPGERVVVSGAEVLLGAEAPPADSGED